MAVQFVQHAQGTISNATAGTVTFGTATTAGNTVVTALSYYTAGGTIAVSGMTLNGAAGNFTQQGSITPSGGPYAAIWENWQIAGGGSLVAVDFSHAGYAAVDAYEVSGLVPTGAYVVSSGSASSGTAWTSGSAGGIQESAFTVGIGAGPKTVAGPNTIVTGVPWVNESGQTWSSGGTLGEISGYVISATGYGVQPTGSSTYAGTCASGNWAGMLAFFAAAVTPNPSLPMLMAGYGPQQWYMNNQLATPLAFAQQRLVFRATQTTTPTSLSSSVAQIYWDTILEDPWQGWINSLGAWYTPVTGYFQVSITVFTATPPNDWVTLQLQTSASPVFAATVIPYSTQGGCTTGTWYLQQSESDDGIAAYVTAANAGSAFNTSLTAGQQSSMEIMYISDI